MRATRLIAALFAAALTLAVAPVHAQSFPSKPVHLIVSFPPGGPADISARAISDGLSVLLGQPVMVENRPGAGAVAAMQALLSAPADGHTLMLASNVLSTGKFLYKSVGFDPLKDVRAVVGVSKSPHLVVVAPGFNGSGINDLIRLAKEQPGKLNCATAGAGTMPHLGAELFQQVTATRMTLIPYKGSGAALPAVMGGQVDVYFDIMFSAATLVKAGKLKALGVTGLQRADAFPDVPTLDEQGIKGYELYSTFGVIAPGGTPDPVVAQLNEAINKVLATPSVRERLAALGATPIGGPPRVFQAMIDGDYHTWGRVIRAAGIAPE
jgi:tripartite-type tricarboxylate transporter receptor subunit TctC